jgi:hypothetical protein
LLFIKHLALYQGSPYGNEADIPREQKFPNKNDAIFCNVGNRHALAISNFVVAAFHFWVSDLLIRTEDAYLRWMDNSWRGFYPGIGSSRVGLGLKNKSVRLGPREQQIANLLLQGCDNAEIGKELNMASRTVKAYFNRLFTRFDIHGGIKRVKLATLLYRRQLWSEKLEDTAAATPTNENKESLNSSRKASKTAKSLAPLEPRNMS